MRSRLLSLLALVPLAVPAGAQSPRPTPSPRVYTDEDLRQLHPEPSPTPTPLPGAKGRATPSPSATPAPSATPRGWRAPGASPGTAPTASPTPEASERTSRAADEARWRARAKELRDALTRAESRVGEIELRIAQLRDDLSPNRVNDPNRQQSIQAEVTAALADLDKAQADLKSARQALADLEDEARREGALPGWIR